MLGTDVRQTRLSWTATAPGHNATQSAYQLLVATWPDRLKPGAADVWDSGKVASPRAGGVPYEGSPLAPGTRYHWSVRLWDGAGRATEWAKPAWFETGLLDESFGAARWVETRRRGPTAGSRCRLMDLVRGRQRQQRPVGPRWLRGRLALPSGVRVAAAHLVMTADDDFTAYLNGQRVLHAPQQADGWKNAQAADVTELARAAVGGALTVAVVATNRPGPAVNPAGLLGKLVVVTEDGERFVPVTDSSWHATDFEPPGWPEPGHDDWGWAPVAVLAPYGQGPWGSKGAGPWTSSTRSSSVSLIANGPACSPALSVRHKTPHLRTPVAAFGQLACEGFTQGMLNGRNETIQRRPHPFSLRRRTSCCT